MKERNLLPMLCVLLVGLVLLPVSPLFQQVPHLDSGVYAYVGWRILEGEVPYRDVWDHKPPGVHYIDALGLWIGSGSMWGIWVLEYLFLLAAAAIGFIVLRRAFGCTAAGWATAAWLLGLSLVLSGGNRPEEFALPLQFALLYLFLAAEHRPDHSRYAYGMGVLGACMLVLKPTLVGLWAAAVTCMVLSQVRSRAWQDLGQRLLAHALGAATVLVPILAFLTARGALPEMVDVLIRFNRVYSSCTLLRLRLQAVYDGLELLSHSGLSILALAAWMHGLWSILNGTGGREGGQHLMRLALIALPMEFLWVAMAGRSFDHYYIAWLPALAMLAAWLIHNLYRGAASGLRPSFSARGAREGRVWLLVLLAAMSLQPAGILLQQVIAGRNEAPKPSTVLQTVAYLQQHTMPEDTVLVWGGDARVNFLARRRAPTRFVYQYPLYLTDYQTVSLVQGFLQDLSASKPAVVVDNWTAGLDVDPEGFGARQKQLWDSEPPTLWWTWPTEMDAVLDHISANYQFVASVGPLKWPVYAYAGADPRPNGTR